MTAIDDLGLTPNLTPGGILTAPFTVWTSGMRNGHDLFGFYGRRMQPVQFWDMTPRLRNLIGVRPRGTVDSPPLLYVDENGFVLVHVRPQGDLQLTLFCTPTSG